MTDDRTSAGVCWRCSCGRPPVRQTPDCATRVATVSTGNVAARWPGQYLPPSWACRLLRGLAGPLPVGWCCSGPSPVPAVTKAHARSEEISLHLAQKRKSPTAGAWGGVDFFETRTSCVSNTRKQGGVSGGLTMLHRVQRQGVTIAVTMPHAAQGRSCCWVGAVSCTTRLSPFVRQRVGCPVSLLFLAHMPFARSFPVRQIAINPRFRRFE